MSFEGGFQGRTNKLVDGCYSFWVGALCVLLDKHYVNARAYLSDFDDFDLEAKQGYSGWIFDQMSLQKYILYCGQDPRGGLRDKPKAPADAYHTCYCLSGFTLAQHNPFYSEEPLCLVGVEANEVEAIDPVYNISPYKVRALVAAME